MARNRFDEDEVLKTPFGVSQFKRALTYVTHYKMGMINSLLLSVLSALLSLSTPIITIHVIDNIIPSKSIKNLILWVTIFLITILISMFLTTVRAKLMTKVGQAIVYDIRSDLFEHLQYLPFDYYDARPQGKILIRVVNYVNAVSDMLSNGLINLILEVVNVFIIMGFMFFVNVQLSFIILSGVPIGLTAILIIRNKQRKAWQDLSNKSSNTNAYLQESITGMQITQIYNRESQNLNIFSNLSDDYRKSWIKAVKLNALFPFIIDNLMNIITAAIYGVSLLIIGPSNLSLGVILAMGSYALRFWNPILSIANIFNTFVTSISYLERIFETMDEPLSIQDKEGAYELKNIEGKVSFKDVSFGYDPHKYVIENINFDIEPGMRVAIVGATGAGKTTIVNLLSRFYDLDSGSIEIDGHNIQDVTLKSLRKQMGIMMQDNYIFNTSIKENIRYGSFDVNDEKIYEVTKSLSIDSFINSYEEGYDTIVSNQSGRLSEGQKQLVAMARTLIRDPKILILDEATSSIDTQTEILVQNGLKHIMKGRTSFIIAHRLSTIKDADLIFYMDNKSIEEKGTHESLMALKGKYYNLVNANIE